MSMSNIYSIKDTVAKTYSQPCIFSSDEVAKRSFGDMITSPAYAKHRADYRLFRIGSFDHDNGSISPESDPVFIACGDNFAFMDGDESV